MRISGYGLCIVNGNFSKLGGMPGVEGKFCWPQMGLNFLDIARLLVHFQNCPFWLHEGHMF